MLSVAGGNDDAVYTYTLSAGVWSLAGKIALGHKTSNNPNAGVGIRVQPNASGLGISADGKTLVVANNYNDSISVIDTQTRTVRYEHDLRPYFVNNEGIEGGVGGTFPFAVAVQGNHTAYVSSDRDREVVVIDISSPTQGHLIKRIKLDGNALGMTLDAAQRTLCVAQDNADMVAVIDTSTNTLTRQIDARAPRGLLPSEAHGKHGRRARHTGAATFAANFSPNGKTLYAVNAGANSIAVIPLKGERAYQVTSLIPTAYEPHDITISADGMWMYIVNGKSITGPNPGHLSGATRCLGVPECTQPLPENEQAATAARASNQYQALSSMPCWKPERPCATTAFW